MSFIIALLIIIFLSVSISYVFNKKFEYILPIAAAAISAIMYSFAYLNIRFLGVVIITLIMIITVSYSIYKRIHNHSKLNLTFRSSGLIYLVLIALFVYVITQGFVFSTWDEFSHWGLVLKNIFLSNNFGNLSSSTTYFQSYPPGISMFLSFINSFSNTFSESNALRGLLILSFAQLIIVFAKIKYNDWKKILLVSLCIIATPLIFFSGFYSSVYVDAIMGLIFCNILFFNYTYHKRDLFYTIYMSLQFYLLVNTKQIGIELAVIAFIAILFSFIRTKGHNGFISFINKNKRKVIYIFIPIIVGILTNVSWKIYVEYNNLSELFQISNVKISDLLAGNIPGYWKNTIVNFINSFLNISQHSAVFYSNFLLSIILLIILFYIFNKNRQSNKQNFILQAFSFIGLYLYAGSILFMYLFSFSEYEAQNLASIDRYIGTYLLGIFIFCLFIVIDYIIDNKSTKFSSNIKLTTVLVVILCITPMSVLASDTLLSPITNKNRQEKRKQFQDTIKYANTLNSKTDKVYIISQNSQGEDYWILRYDFTPIHVSPNMSWSLGSPYYSGDIWTTNITADELSNKLKDYTYVYLNNIDDKFKDIYGRLFDNINDINNKSIYSVNKVGNSIILKNMTQKMKENN